MVGISPSNIYISLFDLFSSLSFSISFFLILILFQFLGSLTYQLLLILFDILYYVPWISCLVPQPLPLWASFQSTAFFGLRAFISLFPLSTSILPLLSLNSSLDISSSLGRKEETVRLECRWTDRAELHPFLSFSVDRLGPLVPTLSQGLPTQTWKNRIYWFMSLFYLYPLKLYRTFRGYPAATWLQHNWPITGAEGSYKASDGYYFIMIKVV